MSIEANIKFQVTLMLSIFLHLLILGLVYFNIRATNKKSLEQNQLLTFKMIPVDGIQNIKTKCQTQYQDILSNHKKNNKKIYIRTNNKIFSI